MRQFFAIFLLAVCAFAQAEGPTAGTGLPWKTDLDAAMTESRAAGKPILFVIMKDKEIACTRMLALYRDPEVREKLKAFILVPCSTFMHEEVATGTGTAPTCPQFPGVTCADHQKCDRLMREKFQATAVVVAPQHLVVNGDGKEVLRREYEMKKPTFLKWLDSAKAAFEGRPAEPESQPAEAAASRPAGEAPKSKSNYPPDIERQVSLIVKGNAELKEQASKDLLRGGNAEKGGAWLDALKQVSASKDKGIVIRAGGYPEFAASVKTMMEALAEKDTFARNCAVVSLEEMANPECVDRLLELRKTERDSEVKKDIIRALGPCNGGRADVKDVLLKELKASSETMRMAAALSLGWLASDPDVQAALKKAYAAESSNKVKTAILFGITNSKDPANTDLLDAMTKDEKNATLKSVADGVRGMLGGGAPNAGGGEGGGGGGRGGRGGRRGGGAGGMMGFWRSIGVIYADDKVQRHAAEEFMRRMAEGGRGN